jgi:LmbE family N-acetylglucosaminyl deacetylase
VTSTERDGPAGRILLVEDDPVAAHLVKRVLTERGGFDVMHTPDPAVALDWVRSAAWDLVLTDAEMPGMTGIEFLGAVRGLAPDLPVAVITAHESADVSMRALRDRADDFLQKPVPPDRLLATVASLAAKGRAARPAARQSVLAIGAHPDDVEIGAAGTLLVHRAMGHQVSILTLTRGDRGGTQNARSGESEMATLALGATLFLADLKDTQLAEGDHAIGAIGHVVETVRPTVIYTHSFHDVHQDHRNAHRAAIMAVREVGRGYCFQSPSAAVDFWPTRFVSIDEQLERKVMVVSAFASQAQVRAYLEQDLIESTAKYWSRFGDGRFAEAFEVIHEAARGSKGDSTLPALATAMPAAGTCRPSA